MSAARCIVSSSYSRAVFALLLLGASVTVPIAARGLQITVSHDGPQAAALSGIVVDASGKPVGSTRVSVKAQDSARAIQMKTDPSGTFHFQVLSPGGYTVQAGKQAAQSDSLSLVVTKGSHQNVRLVLHVSGTPQAGSGAGSGQVADSMDFVDKPTFTVAGVTDWTAVGGHGSDATLRTSEELNREALALRAAQPAAARVNGDKASDEYNLAWSLRNAGDFTAAMVHVKRAIAERDAGDFHRLAGELEEALGDPLAAVQDEQRATQLDPSEENYFAWGSELLLHRAIWQAADVFANGAKVYPSSARVKTAWGAALFAGAQYDEAAVKICQASDLDPSAREPYLFAGQIGLASPSTAGCIPEKLRRFLALRPNDPEANYLSAMFLLKHGTGADQDRVQHLLLRAVALDPQCSDAYLQLGILSVALKDYTGAIAYYRQALEADPRKGEAHYRLGIAYDRTGHPSEAQKEYQLHEQIAAEDAALVEQERREVKQFSVVTHALP